MEILLVAIPVVLLALGAIALRGSSSRASAAHGRTSRNRREPLSSRDPDEFGDEDEDDDDYTPGFRASVPGEKWAPDLPRPPGQWKIHATQEVRGIQYRGEAARDFIRTAKAAELSGRPFGLRLEAEPNNAHDRNAQKVIGFVEDQNFFIGYLETGSAKEIAEVFPSDMPYHVLLRRAYVKPDWIEIYFDVLIPAVRSPFWKGRTNPFA